MCIQCIQNKCGMSIKLLNPENPTPIMFHCWGIQYGMNTCRSMVYLWMVDWVVPANLFFLQNFQTIPLEEIWIHFNTVYIADCCAHRLQDLGNEILRMYKQTAELLFHTCSKHCQTNQSYKSLNVSWENSDFLPINDSRLS